MGELFPNATRRWPRTFMFAGICLIMVATIGMLILAVILFGISAPVYLAVFGLILSIVSAVRGDIEDQKWRKP